MSQADRLRYSTHMSNNNNSSLQDPDTGVRTLPVCPSNAAGVCYLHVQLIAGGVIIPSTVVIASS